MQYDAVIKRRQMENKTSCIHNMEKENCFYCNGNYLQSSKKDSRKKVVDEELLAKYEEIKERFKNFKEIWTEEEILVVYESLNGISKRELRKHVFLTAIKVERTINAVMWMYLHLFSARSDLHRGEVVKQFRKEFSIA